MIPLLAPFWSFQSDVAGSYLGSSVSAADVNGDGFSDVLVGAPTYDVGGGVFSWFGSPSGPGPVPDGILIGDEPSGFFGTVVSPAGDVDGDGYEDMVASAPIQSGIVSAHLGSATGLATVAAWTLELGTVVLWPANAGDVDGDGYDDVIVGEPQYFDATLGRTMGRATAYLGSATGLSATEVWSAFDPLPPGGFGQSIASAGDVNGDGYDDVIVGAPSSSAGESGEGRAYVYLGSATGLESSPAWTEEPNTDRTLFGASVASAGDVDGDGFGDVIVGGNYYPDGLEHGRAYVFLGSVDGLDTTSVWEVSPPDPSGYGVSVSSAGDVDGDGYDDVVVGAYFYAGVGAAFVYLGSATGPATTAACMMESEIASSFFGRSVSDAGDVDGDGFDDVVVGAEIHTEPETNEGAVFLYSGGRCTDIDGDGVLNDLDVCAGDDASGDADADGVCVSNAEGTVQDCDDTEATDYPEAPELCDGVDNACTGTVPVDELDTDQDGWFLCGGECDDLDPTAWPGAPELCDGADNACAGAIPLDEIDLDADGLAICEGDCNDADGREHPGAVELCDGRDNSCAGSVAADEIDTDNDGFRPCAGDCDDTDPRTWPGAAEICDGALNDCAADLAADELDADGDGFMPCAGDCDDGDANIWPGAPELCDGIDNTCAGTVPATEADADDDGVFACAGDCEDWNADAASGLAEQCHDHVDNNCNGEVDEDCANAPPAAESSRCDAGAAGPATLTPWLALMAMLRRRRSLYPSPVTGTDQNVARAPSSGTTVGPITKSCSL